MVITVANQKMLAELYGETEDAEWRCRRIVGTEDEENIIEPCCMRPKCMECSNGRHGRLYLDRHFNLHQAHLLADFMQGCKWSGILERECLDVQTLMTEEKVAFGLNALNFPTSRRTIQRRHPELDTTIQHSLIEDRYQAKGFTLGAHVTAEQIITAKQLLYI